jgi:hypothetical protein
LTEIAKHEREARKYLVLSVGVFAGTKVLELDRIATTLVARSHLPDFEGAVANWARRFLHGA